MRGWHFVVLGSVLHSGCSCTVVPFSSYYCSILVMLVVAVVVILGSQVNHCVQMKDYGTHRFVSFLSFLHCSGQRKIVCRSSIQIKPV